MDAASGRQQVAILTGAAGGIGHAIALALARLGWALVLTDRDAASLAEVQRACGALTPEVSVLAADVTREDDVAGVLRHTLARHGHVDGIVSNAGIAGVVQAVPDYPGAVFRQVLDVNVMGTFHCLQHGLPALRQAGGGSFVVMGSTSSIRGRAHLAGYVASKHAVLGLMRSAALECVGSDVRVNAVLPGPTQTAMIDAIDAMATQRIPAGGAVRRAVSAPYGTPQDVAHTVAFLLSPASRHMNGSALVIDGGSTLS